MPGPRILLADDDADLAGILAQRLRADGYEVLLAPDGVEALQRLEADAPAMAFLDVHMPGRTGLEVCRAARQAPWGKDLPILILTSSVEEGTVRGALDAGANGYLLKPPRYEEVLAEVRRALGKVGEAAEDVPVSPKLTGLVEKVNKLPALPVVTQKLMEVLNNPSAGAKELSRVIALDPAVAAQVLRLANSAYYGQPGKVSDITKAVILIGFSEISHTLMALSLANVFSSKAPEILPRQAFWEHAVGCSVMASQLARRAGLAEPQRALIAGLLHDLGKLVMATYLPQEYAEILKRASAERRHAREVERELLGDNHSLVGEALAQRWGLPPEICRSIRYHHAPLSVENLDHDTVTLVRVVNAADALCKAGGIGSSGDDLLEDVPERVWQLLAVDQKLAEAVVALGHKTVQLQKAALGARDGPGAPPAVPALLLLETGHAVAAVALALKATGFAPQRVQAWSDGMQVLADAPDIRLVVVDSPCAPKESRFLETLLRWRGDQPWPAVLFLAPARQLQGLPVLPRLAACPRPLSRAQLKAAAAAIMA